MTMPPSTQSPNVAEVADAPTRARVLALLKQHGWNATSFQVLEPGYEYFFSGPGACVAYVDTGAAWVAAGAPIAPTAELQAVADHFTTAARQAGRRALFFATEPRFTGAVNLTSLCIGEQPVWDPAEWAQTLQQSRSLREQLRRARAKGVQVRLLPAAELQDPQAPIRRAVEGLVGRWLGTRQMAPMGFLVQLHLFTEAAERRCLVAEVDGRLVGVLGMIPVYARGGWFCEDLLRAPNAPNGTIELLVDAAMRLSSDSRSRYVTLGLAALSGSLPAPLRAARRWGAALYDFEGLRSFKAKLRPKQWVPISLSYPAGQSGLLGVLDVLTAFARGGLLRFGIETLLRGPAVVVRLLAALLLPWTLLLALAPARYFPGPAVKWAWVGFDVLLAAALLRLTYGWQAGLATLLAVLVSGDAALTLLEVLAYNVPHRHSALELVLATVAVSGPALSAFLLIRGRLHRQRKLEPEPAPARPG